MGRRALLAADLVKFESWELLSRDTRTRADVGEAQRARIVANKGVRALPTRFIEIVDVEIVMIDGLRFEGVEVEEPERLDGVDSFLFKELFPKVFFGERSERTTPCAARRASETVDISFTISEAVRTVSRASHYLV